MVRRTIPGRELPEGAFRFRAGRLCLDFAVTGGEGERSVFERLHRPADLAGWLARSALRAPVTVATDRDLATAKQLREAIWQVADAIARRRPVAAPDLATINRVAAAPPLAPELAGPRTPAVAGGASAGAGDAAGAAGVVRWAEPVTAAAALSSLARDAVDLFGGPAAGRIRVCAGDDCALIFVDTSRPGGRRWCSMERCGNRHKLRAMRERRRDEEVPA